MPPHAIFRLARTFEKGSLRYGARNWEKGQPLCRYIDSALRHLFKFLEGHRDEDHAAQALWNIAALIETQERIRQGRLPAELDDLPPALPSESSAGVERTTLTLSDIKPPRPVEYV